MIAVHIPGVPRGKGRPKFYRRQDGGVGTYTPETTVSYENLVRFATQEAMRGAGPLDGPVALEMFFFLPIPKSAGKKVRADMGAGKVHPAKKPDLDNITKAVLDGMNGVAFHDDAQVVQITALKAYSDRPGAHVVVIPI